MSSGRQVALPFVMTTAAEAGVVADRESGPATVAAVRTKPMNRCLRILRLLEVAESPEGSKGPGMRAAVFVHSSRESVPGGRGDPGREVVRTRCRRMDPGFLSWADLLGARR